MRKRALGIAFGLVCLAAARSQDPPSTSRSSPPTTTAATADEAIDEAYALCDAGQIEKALARLGVAIDQSRSASPSTLGDLLQCRGVILIDAGRHGEAVPDLLAAMRTCGTGSTDAVISCRINLAAAWRGCTEVALELAELTQAVMEARTSNSPLLGDALVSLSRVESLLGSNDEAVAHAEEALSTRATHSSPTQLQVDFAKALFQRGSARGDEDQCARAEKLLREALEPSRLLPAAERSLVLQALGACYHRRGALREALQSSAEALEKSPVLRETPTALQSHGSLLASVGDLAEARRFMRQAVAAAGRQVEVACASGSERAVRGRYQALRNIVSSALSCRDFAIEDREHDAEDLACWLGARGYFEWRSRKARREAEKSASDRDLAAAIAAARRVRTALEGEGADGAKQRNELDMLQRRFAASASPQPPAMPAILTRVAQSLASDSVLLVTATYQRAVRAREGVRTPTSVTSVAAFVLWPTGATHRFELGPVAELARQVDIERTMLRSGLRKPRGRDPETGNGAAERRSFGETLMPVLRVLGTDIRSLVICPDDVLATAPWCAIALPDGGSIGERFRVSYVDHPDTLRDERPLARTASLVVLGDVDLDCGHGDRPATPWRPLDGTKLEADACAAAFASAFPGARSVVLRGELASWAELCKATSECSYLHVSTHGYVADVSSWPTPRDQNSLIGAVQQADPLSRSGLVLAGANRSVPDSLVAATRIAGLDLSNCELAVLACCETNIGPRAFGDAVAGLTAAFRSAGARAVIGTLWPIPDPDTPRFLQLLYDAMWKDGALPSDALMRAQGEAKRLGIPASCWAAFVCYGPVRRR